MPHLTRDQCKRLADETVDRYRDLYARGIPPALAQEQAVAETMEGVDQLAREQGGAAEG